MNRENNIWITICIICLLLIVTTTGCEQKTNKITDYDFQSSTPTIDPVQTLKTLYNLDNIDLPLSGFIGKTINEINDIFGKPDYTDVPTYWVGARKEIIMKENPSPDIFKIYFTSPAIDNVYGEYYQVGEWRYDKPKNLVMTFKLANSSKKVYSADFNFNVALSGEDLFTVKQLFGYQKITAYAMKFISGGNNILVYFVGNIDKNPDRNIQFYLILPPGRVNETVNKQTSNLEKSYNTNGWEDFKVIRMTETYRLFGTGEDAYPFVGIPSMAPPW